MRRSVFVCVCMYTYIYIYVCVYVCGGGGMNNPVESDYFCPLYAQVCLCVCVCIYVCLCVYTYIIYIYIYIKTRIHTCICICVIVQYVYLYLRMHKEWFAPSTTKKEYFQNFSRATYIHRFASCIHRFATLRQLPAWMRRRSYTCMYTCTRTEICTSFHFNSAKVEDDTGKKSDKPLACV